MAKFIIGMEILCMPKDEAGRFKWVTSLENGEPQLSNNFSDSMLLDETDAVFFTTLYEFQTTLHDISHMTTLIIKDAIRDELLTLKEFKGLYDVKS